MRFTKMQGIGNDYIYVNCFEEQVENPSALAVRLSDRHFGIGGDGVILIKPSDRADAEMDLYNADGSRAKMCGNGIRCVGKYVYDRGIARKEVLKIDTQSGIKTLYLEVKDDAVQNVRVDMGEPRWNRLKSPQRCRTPRGRRFLYWTGSLPEPACPWATLTLWCSWTRFPPSRWKPMGRSSKRIRPFRSVPISSLSGFAAKMRSKCGFGNVVQGKPGPAAGAGAVAVACILNGHTGRRVLVHLRGGDLQIFWNELTNKVEMTGPAEFVFDGEVKI